MPSNCMCTTLLFPHLSKISVSYFDLSGNKLTLEDLGQVMEEVLDVSVQWYHLGVQLKVRTGTLDRIRTQFHQRSAPGDAQDLVDHQ